MCERTYPPIEYFETNDFQSQVSSQSNHSTSTRDRLAFLVLSSKQLHNAIVYLWLSPSSSCSRFSPNCCEDQSAMVSSPFRTTSSRLLNSLVRPAMKSFSLPLGRGKLIKKASLPKKIFALTKQTWKDAWFSLDDGRHWHDLCQPSLILLQRHRV